MTGDSPTCTKSRRPPTSTGLDTGGFRPPLDDLAAEPGLGISTRDPTSSDLYEYRALDEGRYEVCATFATDAGGSTGSSSIIQRSCQGCHGPGSPIAARLDDPVAAHVAFRDLWAHGAGRHCFQMRVR